MTRTWNRQRQDSTLQNWQKINGTKVVRTVLCPPHQEINSAFPTLTGQRLVAALVRALKTRVKLKSWVCMTNPGAPWAARLPVLCLLAAKNRRRDFWNAALRHRFRFGVTVAEWSSI